MTFFVDFCWQTVKRSYTIEWHPLELCSVSQESDFEGRLSKLQNLYWFESGGFFKQQLHLDESGGKIELSFPKILSPLDNDNDVHLELKCYQLKNSSVKCQLF